jgi:DNA-binding MarR family transcriptional regulator
MAMPLIAEARRPSRTVASPKMTPVLAQMRALGQLRLWGRLSGRELAARLGVTPGTVVPLCDRLEEVGYIRRVPDREDRRLTWLELTSSGDELFRRLWMAGGEKVMEAIAQFTPEDRRTFERLLTQIAEYLEQRSPAERKAD